MKWLCLLLTSPHLYLESTPTFVNAVEESSAVKLDMLQKAHRPTPPKPCLGRQSTKIRTETYRSPGKHKKKEERV
ncbi:hypothetical protein BC941DRAFT_408866, partial [Chlamydoabsidia padenii]